MDIKQLRDYIIIPAIENLPNCNNNSVNLLLFTCFAETDLAEYVKQVPARRAGGNGRRAGGNGPALGIFQCEPNTYNDLYDNYILARPELLKQVGPRDLGRLIYDLRYATKICRIHYLRVREPIPDNTEELVNYWMRYYRTYFTDTEYYIKIFNSVSKNLTQI